MAQAARVARVARACSQLRIRRYGSLSFVRCFGSGDRMWVYTGGSGGAEARRVENKGLESKMDRKGITWRWAIGRPAE